MPSSPHLQRSVIKTLSVARLSFHASVSAKSGCRGHCGLASGKTTPSADSPNSQLAKGFLCVFQTSSYKTRGPFGPRGLLSCGLLGRSVWLSLPLCHLSIFFIFLLCLASCGCSTHPEMTHGMLAPPPSDPLSNGCLRRLTLPRTRTPGLRRGPVTRRCCSVGSAGGVTDEEGTERADLSQNRPLFDVFTSSLPRSSSRQNQPRSPRKRHAVLQRARG